MPCGLETHGDSWMFMDILLCSVFMCCYNFSLIFASSLKTYLSLSCEVYFCSSIRNGHYPAPRLSLSVLFIKEKRGRGSILLIEILCRVSMGIVNFGEGLKSKGGTGQRELLKRFPPQTLRREGAE